MSVCCSFVMLKSFSEYLTGRTSMIMAASPRTRIKFKIEKITKTTLYVSTMSLAESLRMARKFVENTRKESTKSARFNRENPKQKKIQAETSSESGANAANESTREFLMNKTRTLHKNIMINTRICARKQSNISIF